MSDPNVQVRGANQNDAVVQPLPVTVVVHEIRYTLRVSSTGHCVIVSSRLP
jgi:hypothetical protein